MNKREVESALTKHREHIDSLWPEISHVKRALKSAIDEEHNRISVLAPRVDKIWDDQKKLAQLRQDELIDGMKQDEMIRSILRVLVRSGVIEEAVNGDDLFQMINQTDLLQRYPLYKINKVVTR